MNSVKIDIAIKPDEKGHCVCAMALALDGKNRPTRSFHGQSSNHVLAIALEDLAREFRMKAEAEQKIDWLAVDRSPSGKVLEKRFHVVLHYERVDTDESKFEARHNTLLGNSVIENAEVSVIQVDAKLPIRG